MTIDEIRANIDRLDAEYANARGWEEATRIHNERGAGRARRARRRAAREAAEYDRLAARLESAARETGAGEG
jgi:hypothetical protein